MASWRFEKTSKSHSVSICLPDNDIKFISWNRGSSLWLTSFILNPYFYFNLQILYGFLSVFLKYCRLDATLLRMRCRKSQGVTRAGLYVSFSIEFYLNIVSVFRPFLNIYFSTMLIDQSRLTNLIGPNRNKGLIIMPNSPTLLCSFYWQLLQHDPRSPVTYACCILCNAGFIY